MKVLLVLVRRISQAIKHSARLRAHYALLRKQRVALIAAAMNLQAVVKLKEQLVLFSLAISESSAT